MSSEGSFESGEQERFLSLVKEDISYPLIERQVSPEPKRRSHGIKKNLISFKPWIIHGVLILCYLIALLYGYLESHNRSWPNIYNDLPSGKVIKELGSRNLTVFQGRPSRQNEAAWDKLLSVGIVSIDQRENSRMIRPTTWNRNEQDHYVVELDVFHQLHCLKMLRNQVWQPKILSWSDNEPIDWWEFHIDHCIEHLRQTLICNADSTPQRFVWDKEFNVYTLPNNQMFLCQDFDEIWTWAEARNTTGFMPRAAGGVDTKDNVGA